MNDPPAYPDEGGHMSSRFGRIVRTSEARLPTRPF
jgi:hypothetical protein